ncbi:RagB/SusD family nutrient uptake outer membrane protein [uncultured Polaribacter sp.]|uniref:RagB/SusD family nutrient uptake outer membrane protein n=1 Tax=uncultured Polaribacter sp. TaxID=174711 RepID=UPI002631A089|nr:RagB/SusD family nutrient uptake outer membrane protein [uncultured Polaribacter sp.]
MKIFKFTIAIAIAIMVIFVSCDEFLEENPSKTIDVIPETLEQLEALLNNYNVFYREPSNERIFGTDDYAFITDLYDAENSIYSTISISYGAWAVDLIPDITGRVYWPSEWEKIFTANLVLQELGNVPGDAQEKEDIRAECYFIRAYSYFQLATVYCLPYTDANKTELGLPIKQTTSFEENIERATLEETYTFIADDLDKAMKITRSFNKVNNLNRSWRASTAAVNGFAARFYLALNDYVNAQFYAQKALNEYNQLRNYNTDMRFSDIPTEVTIFNPNPTNVSIFYPYTHDQQIVVEDRLQFGESYYFRMLYDAGIGYFPSQELLALYNQVYDLRYKFHIVEDYSYTRNVVDPPYSYPGYVFFYQSDLPSGPSVPEMLLIKAECQVRQGSFVEGIQTVNQLRVARMDASAPASDINLTASSQTDALVKVLEERRREMPYVHRWYDVRRYNNNDNSADDVIMTKTFYPFNIASILGSEPPITYTLDKNSRRFAYPIPEADIIASEGVLQQNKY